MLSPEEIQREIERAKIAPSGDNEYSRREKPTQAPRAAVAEVTRCSADIVSLRNA
jgi:hypothetical protein